jgi:hypothetical protein
MTVKPDIGLSINALNLNTNLIESVRVLKDFLGNI